MSVRTITESLHDKIQESIDRTTHLVTLVPESSLSFHPVSHAHGVVFTDVGHLLGHLLDCLSGFCAAFLAMFPEQLDSFQSLREQPVNHSCSPGEAILRIQRYGDHIRAGFALCSDETLARPLKTVFVPQGESFATILLGNLEHLLNHKHQLFFYLKLLGIPVGTADLYALRKPSGPA